MKLVSAAPVVAVYGVIEPNVAVRSLIESPAALYNCFVIGASVEASVCMTMEDRRRND